MPLSKLYRLAIVLLLLWLLLSGIYTPMLLILGVLSVVLVCYLTVQMQVLDHLGQPFYSRFFHLLRYWCWLLTEMVKSSWSVSCCILHSSLPIKPTLTTIPTTQKTELGRVIYANSITLTPGTIAINIDESGDILVHALHETSVEELLGNTMGSRVTAVEPRNTTTIDHEVKKST